MVKEGSLYLVGENLYYAYNIDESVLTEDVWLTVEVEDTGFRIREKVYNPNTMKYEWTGDFRAMDSESKEVIFSPSGKSFFLVIENGMASLASYEGECEETIQG